MVITLNIQGASPDEIRETCKQFAEMGINNRVVITPEDLGISQAPQGEVGGSRLTLCLPAFVLFTC